MWVWGFRPSAPSPYRIAWHESAPTERPGAPQWRGAVKLDAGGKALANEGCAGKLMYSWCVFFLTMYIFLIFYGDFLKCWTGPPLWNTGGSLPRYDSLPAAPSSISAQLHQSETVEPCPAPRQEILVLEREVVEMVETCWNKPPEALVQNGQINPQSSWTHRRSNWWWRLPGQRRNPSKSLARLLYIVAPKKPVSNSWAKTCHLWEGR